MIGTFWKINPKYFSLKPYDFIFEHRLGIVQQES